VYLVGILPKVMVFQFGISWFSESLEVKMECAYSVAQTLVLYIWL
jgi:hypothetical protein